MARREADDWDFVDEDPPWPVSRPVLATFGVMLAMAVVSALATPELPAVGPALLGYTAGEVVAGYALLYVVGLRRRGVGWKISGLVILLLFAILSNFGRVAMQNRLAVGDLDALHNDVAAVVDGRDLAPGLSNDHSLAGVMRNMLVKLQSDQRDYGQRLTEVGVDALASPAAIAARPDVLAKCSRLDDFDATITSFRDRWSSRLSEARAALDARHDAGGAAAVEGFDKSIARGRPEAERRWEIEHARIRQVAQMCRIVARRHWQPGADFMFTSDRDFRDYRAAATRYNALVGEQQKLQAGFEARTREAMQEMTH